MPGVPPVFAGLPQSQVVHPLPSGAHACAPRHAPGPKHVRVSPRTQTASPPPVALVARPLSDEPSAPPAAWLDRPKRVTSVPEQPNTTSTARSPRSSMLVNVSGPGPRCPGRLPHGARVTGGSARDRLHLVERGHLRSIVNFCPSIRGDHLVNYDNDGRKSDTRAEEVSSEHDCLRFHGALYERARKSFLAPNSSAKRTRAVFG